MPTSYFDLWYNAIKAIIGETNYTEFFSGFFAIIFICITFCVIISFFLRLLGIKRIK